MAKQSTNVNTHFVPKSRIGALRPIPPDKKRDWLKYAIGIVLLALLAYLFTQ